MVNGSMTTPRTPYLTDLSDDQRAFVALYLMLLPEDGGQRTYSLCEMFNELRWMVRAGASWRMIPHDLPPWHTLYDQTQHWLAAGCFEEIVRYLRLLLCGVKVSKGQPSAAIFDCRTMQFTPESGQHAGFDGAKQRKVSKGHVTVDTFGHLLALLVIPANEQDRTQIYELAQKVQEETGQAVQIALVDQGCSGAVPAQVALERGIQLEVVKLPEAKRGFVLLPRC